MRFVLNIFILTAFPLSANAQAIGYVLDVFGSTNIPTFALTNSSDTANIESFSMTIGDTSRNFDTGTVTSAPGISFTLNSPDTNLSGGIRSDLVDFSFSFGFEPGATFSFTADVDIDSSNTTQDYRSVLFNNGAAPNSVITLGFSGGLNLSQEMPDASFLSSYSFSQSEVIPGPAIAPLVFGLVAAFVTVRRRYFRPQ